MTRQRRFDPFRTRLPERRQPQSAVTLPLHRKTRAGSYTIHSVETHGTGPELVLLHGLSGSGRWWARNLTSLGDHHRLLVPDLVGYGRTPLIGRVPELPAMADLLAMWLDALELEQVDLIGHSMGGQVAVHFSARYPDRVGRLVLVDAAGIPRPITPRYVVRFALEIAPLWRWGDPSFLPVIVSDAWTAGPRTLLRSIAHILRDDVRPLLPQILAPTLIVWGELDSWVPVAHALEMRRAIPESSLVILRRAAHMPMVDRPQAFNRLVLRFLEGGHVGS